MDTRKSQKKPQEPNEELRRLEERFESLIELSTEWYWEQDEKYRFTLMSGSTAGHGGIEPKSVVGTFRWARGAVPVGDGGSWDKHKAVLQARQPFKDFLYTRPSPTGETRYITTSGQPVFDDKGRFRGYRGIARDITESRRADELLGLEHAITRHLANAERLSDGIKAALREVCESQGWEVGRYFMADEKAGVLRFVDAWSRPDPALEEFLADSRKATFAPGVGVAGKVWQTGQPLWVPDLSKDSRALLVVSTVRTGIRGAFHFPAVAEGRTIGVVTFSSREVREPDARLLRAVRVIGSQIGQFVRRKHSEEVLRESEERFRSLTKLSSDWYWEQDENFRFTQMTSVTKDATGRGPSSSIGKTRWDLPALNMTDADWAAHRAVLEAHQPFYDLELCRRTPDGTLKYTSISGEPIFDQSGAFRGYRGVGKDITARKREELLLNLEHAVTRCLSEADSASAALKAVIRTVCESQGWECGRYFYADEKAGLLRFGGAWGIQDPAIERYIEGSRTYTSPLDRGAKARVWQTREPLWNSEVSRQGHLVQSTLGSARDSFVFAVTSQDKALGVFSFTSRALRKPDERMLRAVGVIGSQIGQFLQRKQAEDVMRTSEERFRSLTALSSDFYWETDAEHRLVETEYDRKSQHVVPRSIRSGKTRWELPSIYPDAQGWAAHRATLEAHQPFRDFELGRVDADGVERHLSISGEPVFDAEGNFRGYRGVGTDITARKQAEKVLRASEERFRALTELSSDLYWTQDSEHRFTSFSGSNATAPQRLIGKRRWDESAVNLTEADWAKHIADMDAHRPFRDFEVARVNPQGRMFWVSISGAPVFDDAGKFVGYQGIVKNITERKRAEELQALEHAVTRCLAEAESVNGALKSVMRVVCEGLGWECGRYFRKDDAAGVFRFAESWYVPSPAMDSFIAYSVERTFTPGVGIVGMAGAGEPQWVADLAQDARVINKKMMAGDHGMRGAFMFPVLAGGASLGVLSFTSREIREPDKRLLQAARIIGAQIGQFLQRKRAEEVVRESEERFRSLTQLSSDMYWEQDEQFRFTSMSGTGSQRVNVKTFPTIGKKRWEQNYINMSADQWGEHIALLEAHKEFRDLELCRVDESGKKIWISISGEPVFDSAGVFKGYRGVGKDITERKQDEERIQFLANHDALTSLPNRAMFGEVLNLSIQNARRYNRGFAVLFIDLDRFKNINDTLGHDVGDKLLQEMGKRLTQTVRASDVVARLGGDEFVVLVQEVAEGKQVASVARKILSALVHPMTIQGQECRVTASIGICMFPSEAQDELALMKNADIAMYRAKEDGKNNYKFYSEEMNVHTFERLALETSLRRGLERSEFVLHYQAKLDLHTRKISGVEALVRWQHPEMGMVPPAQFIPLAEETGLIVPIGRWVLQTACAQSVAWQKQGLPPIHIAVNLSARQFADEDLVEDIARALKNTGLQPELLELELTESMVIQNTERAGKVLNEIKKMGVRLAIDDFGVGYSSLTHLKRFPIDTLKVDRSFIRDLPDDIEDKAITEAIIAMGKSLNLTVVAEGVETEAQQTFLHDHACDEMQGYFFSKPIAADAFAELLRKRVEARKQ